jgi:hypothetical protein
MVKPRRAVTLDDADKFKFDYEQTAQYFHELPPSDSSSSPSFQSSRVPL